jgi:hypothetical protein
MKRLIVLACFALGACAMSSERERMSPRKAAYSELRSGMTKLQVANVLRGNRHVRFVQMGDPSDPREDLEYWYYSNDPENDYVVFTYDGKLLQWEYHDPLVTSRSPSTPVMR